MRSSLKRQLVWTAVGIGIFAAAGYAGLSPVASLLGISIVFGVICAMTGVFEVPASPVPDDPENSFDLAAFYGFSLVLGPVMAALASVGTYKLFDKALNLSGLESGICFGLSCLCGLLALVCVCIALYVWVKLLWGVVKFLCWSFPRSAYYGFKLLVL